MLIDDIIREVWLNGSEWTGGVMLVYAILTVVAIGGVAESGLYGHEDRDGIWASVVTFVTMLIVLLLLAFVPTSPLIGVTGNLFPSPWSHGLYPGLCFSILLTSLVYGLVSGTTHSLKDVINLLCYGIRHWPWVILLAMLLSFTLNFQL